MAAVGTPHTEIVVDCDRYTGNFEREFSACVFGVIPFGWDLDGHRQPDYLHLDPALAWAREDFETYEEGALASVLDEDHGPGWQQIESSAGWVEADPGHYVKPTADINPATTSSVCQSVRWIFTRTLSDEEIESVHARVLSFAGEWNASKDQRRYENYDLCIEGFRVFEVMETRTESLQV
jgi:hypothetical protein